jgi:Flp pilus assembly pilin Flp
VAHFVARDLLERRCRSLAVVQVGGEDTVVTVTPVPEPVGRAAGQTLAEYALILSIIAILAVAALLFLGGAIAEQLSQVGIQI